MKYGSVCSGIEAATMAWHVMGWEPAFFSEIEPFPCSVLQHHYPTVPNLGDMTKYEEWPDHAIDLLVGGTPCQSFSVAGLRQGLADPRGNLMLTYLAIARRYQPRWLVWENVPGVLSSNGGRDFGTFIRGLEECGYHAAWRVLDAQYVRVDGFPYAVPQRRRRVFVVGYLGDWRRAAAVLLEREGLRGDSPPSRQSGKGFARDVAQCLVSSGRGVERTGDTRGQDNVVAQAVAPTLNAAFGSKLGLENQHIDSGAGMFVASRPVAATLARGAESSGKGGYAGRRQEDDDNLVAHSLRGEGFDASEDGTGRGTPIVPVAFNPKAGGNKTIGKSYLTDGSSYTLDTDCTSVAIASGWAVRRLTPTECERLQGFPDNFTAVPHRNKPAADGPRYKALGNSMAVNCMRWLGRRIEHVEALSQAESEAA